MKGFNALQAGLADVLAANTAGSGTRHVVILMPSFSVSEALYSHYGDRVVALEHRYLLAALMTHRIGDVELVYLSSLAPTPGVVGYYRSLGPRPDEFAARARFVGVDDLSPRCMADKLFDRPDLVEWLGRFIDGRPAMIEPWNVTEHEVAVAQKLQLPVNGLDPSLRHLGFKSAGRRMFSEVGVPVPYGCEDVRTTDDLLGAISSIQAARPRSSRVVVKHDDSAAGDGNVVLDLREPSGQAATRETLRSVVQGLPGWYLSDLQRGGVVEEFVTSQEFSSPSAQVDLLPDGPAVVLATHEQVLGGDTGQTFLGCRFPANPAYAGQLASHAQAVGARLAAAGVVGRISIDFTAAREDGERWRLYALEVNLRKGGTTHPYAALRNLVPGRYDADTGAWVSADGSPRAYVCTDNLVDASWVGLAPEVVIRAVEVAGLRFDHRTGTGVVLHMLAGLSIDGRIGLTALGVDPDHAQAMYGHTRNVVSRAAAQRPDAHS